MLGLTSIGSVMVALDVLVVAAALTTIRQDLGASIEQLEWTVNAYSLSFAMLLMTAAAIGDRWGRRRTFAAGLALFSRRLGRLRAGDLGAVADRCPRRSGHRRGGRDAARDGPARRRASHPNVAAGRSAFSAA